MEKRSKFSVLLQPRCFTLYSLISLLTLKEYKAIIHSQTLFGFFNISTYVLVSSFYNQNLGFVAQIPVIHIVNFSFNFNRFVFKDFSYSSSSKLLI